MDTIPTDLAQEYEHAIAHLRAAHNAYVMETEDANTAIETLRQRLQRVIAAYNAQIERVNAVRERIAEAIGEYYDAADVPWKQSERGQAFLRWRDAWDTQFENLDDADLDTLWTEDLPGLDLDDEYAPLQPDL